MWLGADGALELRGAAAPHGAPTFDAILNCASYEDEPTLVPLLRPDAIGLATIVHPLISTLDSRGWISGALQARRTWKERSALVRATGAKCYRWVMFKPDAAAILELSRMLGSGALDAPVGAVFPMEQAAEAHARVERGGAVGKTVLVIPQ
jgi:NADPH:quinone reductase-like Zn-dependent oxidoreductase